MQKIHIVELDPGKEVEQFAWILWQGFNHGTDREEFEVVGRVVVAIVVEAGVLFVDAVEIEIFSINDANAVVGTEEGIGTLLAE